MRDEYRWFVYSLDAITDYWWGMKPVAAVVAEIDATHPDGRVVGYIEHELNAAKKAAIEAGWEGDIIQGPFVVMLPAMSDYCWLGDYEAWVAMFAWKQSNNGRTYLVSRIRLPFQEDGQ